MRSRTTASWLVLACVLTVAACGSSASNHGSTTGSTPSSTSVPAGVLTPSTQALQIENSPPGDIPDNQAYVAYSPASGGYRIKVPEGWARSTAGSAAVFTDKYNAIKIEVRRASAAPTVASVKTSELQGLEKSTLGYRPGTVSSVMRTGGPVVLITYQAASPPNDVTGKSVLLDVERYEYWAGGREAVVTLSGSVGSDNVDPWKIVTNSFGWT